MQKEKGNTGLFWGASQGRLWHLLLLCVPTVSFVWSYLPKVNYSGPEWAFLPGPWADFNYHPLPMWIEEMREEELAWLLPVKHTQKQQFTQKPLLCFLCCQALQQKAECCIFYCFLERSSSSSVWEPLGGCYTGFSVCLVFRNYYFKVLTHNFILVGLVWITIEHS